MHVKHWPASQLANRGGAILSIKEDIGAPAETPHHLARVDDPRAVDFVDPQSVIVPIADQVVPAGAGQPLGVLNADCLIEASAESGQTSSDPFLYENAINMRARLPFSSLPKAVWIMNQTVLPYLQKMSIAFGTGDNVDKQFRGRGAKSHYRQSDEQIGYIQSSGNRCRAVNQNVRPLD